jgi:acetoin utilization deacetylase AcuC-like enzyme
MSSALDRACARWRLRKSLAIWHHAGYAPCCLERSARNTSPALRRAERVVAQLESESLLRPGDLRRPVPASLANLAAAHTRSYLEESGTPEVLARVFALEPGTFAPDPLVEAQRLAVGGTLAAARAVSGGLGVGVNLGGGFHHAAADRGGGFCLYNDVVTSVRCLREEGLAQRVAVIDLDFHQGDGTLAALAQDSDVLQYSVHGAVWQHGNGGDWQIALPAGTDDSTYLDALRRTLPGALRSHRPTLAFFLAGNDVLAGDPLGTFALTAAGVMERDRFVVQCAREAGAGLVVLMAGGYGRHAWAGTANLLRWLLCGAVRLDAPEATDIHRRFAAMSPGLSAAGLVDGGVLTEAEVLADLGVGAPARRLLDFYSPGGLEYALERYGVLDRLRKRGFSDLHLSLDATDAQRQVVRLKGRPAEGQPVVLAELCLARRRLPWPVPGESEDALDLLEVGWLLMQDPTASFSLERPRLPGQEHPGLGLADEVQELLVQACRRLGLDGVVMRPGHFHIAAGAAPAFRFLEPAAEGRLVALRQALSGHAIAEASVLLDAGGVHDAGGRPFVWEPALQVLPVSDRLRRHFESPSYAQARDAAARAVVGQGLAAHAGAAAAIAG